MEPKSEGRGRLIATVLALIQDERMARNAKANLEHGVVVGERGVVDNLDRLAVVLHLHAIPLVGWRGGL